MVKFNQQTKVALLFILPQLAVTIVFFIWPALGAIKQSLFFSDAFGLHHYFSGLANYIDLFDSPEYSKAMIVTLVLAMAITLSTMTLGLSIAMLVNGRYKSQKIYKSLLLWPYAVAPAVAGILWRFLCHPTLGWLTHALRAVGIDFNYIVHSKQALLVLIMAATWQQFSYNFLFYIAALKLLPQSLIEASIIDGASSWRRFWQITLPLLSPTTFFLLVMNLVYSFFDTFGLIQVMTNGGPEYSTTTMMYKVYTDGFVAMDQGSSSAQSVILMFIVVALTLIQFRYLERRVHYQ